MGDIVVPLEGEFAPEEARGWEGKVFRRVCGQGQRGGAAHLEALDEALYEQRPSDWAVVGFRQRTVVTCFGEVCIRRRLYWDESGKYHPLLEGHSSGLLSSQILYPHRCPS